MVDQLEDDGWGITCQCGHFDTFDRFETYEEGHHYQCPECGVEWMITLKMNGSHELWENHGDCQ